MTSTSAARRGGPADLPAIMRLLGSSGLPTSDLLSTKEFQSWVLEEDGSIIGVIGLERFGDEGLLRSLAVATMHRTRGLGHGLVTRLEHDAHEAGIKQLILLTETAEVFFGKLGYSVTDRCDVSQELRQSAEFRSLCPVSAVCMRRALSR